MSFAYTIVGGRENEQSLYFMLNALLQSRIHVNLESTDDEDVNMYLASLLHTYLSDGIHANDTISSYDADVVRNAVPGDLRTRYRVYRANADHALMHAGCRFCASLDRPTVARLPSCPCL